MTAPGHGGRAGGLDARTAAANVTDIRTRLGGSPPPSSRAAALPERPVLRPWMRLQVEQARQCVMDLDGRTAGADLPRAMFLLGELAGHAQQLLDVLDSVVTP